MASADGSRTQARLLVLEDFLGCRTWPCAPLAAGPGFLQRRVGLGGPSVQHGLRLAMGVLGLDAPCGVDLAPASVRLAPRHLCLLSERRADYFVAGCDPQSSGQRCHRLCRRTSRTSGSRPPVEVEQEYYGRRAAGSETVRTLRFARNGGCTEPGWFTLLRFAWPPHAAECAGGAVRTAAGSLGRPKEWG